MASYAADTEYRIEHDTMGEVRVPAKALWRAQTQRAVENFPISGRGLERTQIRALGLLKGACAQVNKDLGLLAPEKADAIIAAAAEIADGQHDDQFPIDVFQTGSGTSSNMNTNEVIASIAARGGVTVHPNDDVNMSQSSNDTFPTATHIAATEAAVRHLIPALEVLHDALASKAREWHTVVKSGRTHLMDAVPVTLGQEFSGYARQIEAGIERVRATLPRLGELAIGGTAVGTGLNAPDGFGAKVVETLIASTGLSELRTAANSFEAQAARDGLVEASGALRTIAVSLTKIANDIRWMGSGPLTGLAEIQLPDLQPGSSIMPGKVNPVLPEAVTQVAAQVIGNDAAVAWGGASGAFELNVYIPMMARNILESFKLLTNVSKLFAERCITGLVANVDHLRGAGRIVAVDRDAVELGDRLRGGRRGGQAGPQGAQDDSPDRDRPWPDRRQTVGRRTGPPPGRLGDGQGRAGEVTGWFSDDGSSRRPLRSGPLRKSVWAGSPLGRPAQGRSLSVPADRPLPVPAPAVSASGTAIPARAIPARALSAGAATGRVRLEAALVDRRGSRRPGRHRAGGHPDGDARRQPRQAIDRRALVDEHHGQPAEGLRADRHRLHAECVRR